MNIYLVGGAVRDKLLSVPVSERDWVVVGATEEQLLDRGFRKVGKDFPVFLHPDSKEEYALARTERKSGPGHTGFVCDANETVTLEEDLLRRDLTINAIAETSDGELIDPYNGVKDINARLLRHVSDAFAEDPLRILRVARFAARFPDFRIHADTINLMEKMVSRGDLDELPPERIYVETDKALGTDKPWQFFTVLRQLGALQQLWPEVTDHGIELLEKMTPLSTNKAYRLAALLWSNNQTQVKAVSTRLRLPNDKVEIASLTESTFETWQYEFLDTDLASAEDIVDWLYRVDVFRRKTRFHRLNGFFSLVAKINGTNDNSAKWQHYCEICKAIPTERLIQKYSGAALGAELKLARINAVLQAR